VLDNVTKRPLLHQMKSRQPKYFGPKMDMAWGYPWVGPLGQIAFHFSGLAVLCGICQKYRIYTYVIQQSQTYV